MQALEAKGAAERGRGRARRLAEAGDLLAAAGLARAAAVRYGGAIDAYLEAGYFNYAYRTCLRLLDAAPGAVRVRATLALILMGKGFGEEAEALVREYVEASRGAGAVGFALRRLCLMAQAAGQEKLRAVILGHIERLRAEAGIESSPCKGCASRCLLAGRSCSTPGGYWERLVDVGVRGPEELTAATPHWDAVASLVPGSLRARAFTPAAAPA